MLLKVSVVIVIDEVVGGDRVGSIRTSASEFVSSGESVAVVRSLRSC